MHLKRSWTNHNSQFSAQPPLGLFTIPQNESRNPNMVDWRVVGLLLFHAIQGITFPWPTHPTTILNSCLAGWPSRKICSGQAYPSRPTKRQHLPHPASHRWAVRAGRCPERGRD